jgi:hypothetical protein
VNRRLAKDAIKPTHLMREETVRLAHTGQGRVELKPAAAETKMAPYTERGRGGRSGCDRTDHTGA